MQTDVNVLIAGSAGEGIQTVGSVLSMAVQRCGYAVFSWQEYESRIRGGLNSYAIRISSSPKNAPRKDADIFLSLSKGAWEKYSPWLSPRTILLTDADGDSAAPSTQAQVIVPFASLAHERWGNTIYANIVAAGALWSLVGGELEVLRSVVETMFRAKRETTYKANLEAAEVGYDLAAQRCAGVCPWRLDRKEHRYFLMNGNTALALGAVRAGCRVMAAYPMTPATGIITFLAQHQAKLKVFVEQAEDEIAAVNMAIGAQFAGCRAMTATSGGGFALMVEGISLAGPATGLPTRTAQGDLLFAIHAGHGEFPKVVLAPADPYDAFHTMIRAFTVADKYQIPVIVMSDQFLADSQHSIPTFHLEQTEVPSFVASPEAFTSYQRYAFTEAGVSPRLFPGQSSHLVTADSDEHDEDGHITEELHRIAVPMMEKRLKKLEAIRREMRPPEGFAMHDAEEVVVGWGSTKYALVEAVEMLRHEGRAIGLLHFTDLWPPPILDGQHLFPKDRLVTVVEQNATGQFANVLRLAYGVERVRSVRFYDGLPLTAEEVRRRL